MHLICNCQSGTVEESAGTWMFATSGSAGPCRADKLSKIFFFLDRERVQGVPETHSSRGGEEYSRETLIYASLAEAATRRIHLGIKSLSKRGGKWL